MTSAPRPPGGPRGPRRPPLKKRPLLLEGRVLGPQLRFPVSKAGEFGFQLLKGGVDIAELNRRPLQGVVDLA